MGLPRILLLGILALSSTVIAASKPGDRSFDYVIVGGGTAGTALAARLSQGLPKASVLLVEAGPAAPDELGILVPGRKGSTLGTRYDWNFTTIPQMHLRGRTVGVNRGRVLGGSSALNLLCWDRAAAAEYDAWAEVGNPGWDWRAMEAAMTRAENYTGGPAGSGRKGPVHAVINRVIPAHQQGWIPAVEKFGIPANNDSLEGRPIGVSYQPSSIDPTRYVRSYSANAYLPIAGPNLVVLTDTQVFKVNFKGTGTKKQNAIGITLANGTVIRAAREVILSAGAVQTPNLLELSGIGQGAVLAAANITQLIELPGVGENYQDHLRVQVSYQLRDNYTSFDVLRSNATVASIELDKWLAGKVSLYDYTGSGFLFANWEQVVGGANASAMAALARAAVGNSSDVGQRKKLEQLADATVPQVEVIFSDGYTGVKGYPAVGTALYGKSFFTLIAGLMHPLSRGNVHLNVSNPLGKPVIDPRFLDNEYDIQAMMAMAKFSRQVALSEPLRSVWTAEYEPGLHIVQTDEQWRDYVLNTTLSVFHPVGTAAMLPRADGGVVDSELVVYGTTNVRVVDASVIPVQISAHIQTAVYGIAERAAEIIMAKQR
ncbi:GMC oxidoreductase [Echria macrotheca]|uniref:GMC oxidoreductase n=1 Tax=Echria macrotheca TaxID=438768 RepID=A0AAJ0BMD5_9PEZI|nr:GMC oxidoreductase [Echria macrotheca]